MTVGVWVLQPTCFAAMHQWHYGTLWGTMWQQPQQVISELKCSNSHQTFNFEELEMKSFLFSWIAHHLRWAPFKRTQWKGNSGSKLNSTDQCLLYLGSAYHPIKEHSSSSDGGAANPDPNVRLFLLVVCCRKMTLALSSLKRKVKKNWARHGSHH